MGTADYHYNTLVHRVLDEGVRFETRTGIDTLAVNGAYMSFDLEKDKFPILTTKKVAWKSAFAEMIGFLNGFDSAAQFRELGCTVWDANANENEEWLGNPARKGRDDLGRIYGVQWRQWMRGVQPLWERRTVDQLRQVYQDLSSGRDNRREIILAWNPGELDQMALPPCHCFMQFGLIGARLNLGVWIRSNDIGLGMPFNISQYAMLLQAMAQITGWAPGTLHYFAFNAHIYVNHIPALREQMSRVSWPAPTLQIHPDIETLNDLLAVRDLDEAFRFDKYLHGDVVKLDMAV